MGEEEDEDEDKLTVVCKANNLLDPACRYKYKYNGTTFATCPYVHGNNRFGYIKSEGNFTYARHVSVDNVADNSWDDEGTKYEYDWVVTTLRIFPWFVSINCRESSDIADVASETQGSPSNCE